MGILRLGVIAAVGVALLPSDSEQQEILYNRAALAAHWTMTFCDRNPQTCTTAAEAWDGFRKKAQFGARLAYDTAMEQLASGQDVPSGGAQAPKRPLETGTLKPADLQPQWRGNPSHGAKTSGRVDARTGG